VWRGDVVHMLDYDTPPPRVAAVVVVVKSIVFISISEAGLQPRQNPSQSALQLFALFHGQ